MHDSFAVDHKIVKAAVGQKLEITYKGWGYFNVPITIYWSKHTGIKEPLELDHMLSFNGNGKWR